ncbi:MAG: S-layer homology domain-containing protein [Eubacterium sp.]|nr:S-layer homology domain-containing protein [Eubacterium sp.]
MKTNKRLHLITSILICVALLVSLVPSFSVKANDPWPFLDVSRSDALANEVYYAYTNGIVSGFSTGDSQGRVNFKPAKNVTRAQYAIMLYKMAGEPGANEKMALNFSDVPKELGCYKAVRWASSFGIISGFSKNGVNTFKPDNNVTRSQFAMMLRRFADYLGIDTSIKVSVNLTAYKDYNEIANGAHEALSWAISRGILSGVGSVSNSKLKPNSPARRDQCAAFLTRGIQNNAVRVVKYSTSFLKTAYNTSNVEIITSGILNMNGRTYYDGLVFSGYYTNNCTASFNVQDINKISFTMGHVDDRAGSNAEIEIYLDDKFYDSYELKQHMKLQNVTLDVSGSSVVRFSLTTSNGSGVYGLTDFKVDSILPKTYSIPEYDSVDEFLSLNFTAHSSEKRLSDDKRNAFKMNGRTYYNGMIFSGYYTNDCDASFNVENVNTLSFTVGHVDDSAESNSEIEIYYDNKYNDSIVLSSHMPLVNMTLDVTDVSVVRFRMTTSNGSGVYGIADFKVDSNTSKKYVVPEYEDIDYFINSGFTSGGIEKKTSDDKRNAFRMNGRTYYNGIILNGYYTNNCTTSMNVENYNTVSFTVGHVDDRSESDSTLKVFLDEKTELTLNLTATMNLSEYTINVANASVIRFALTTSNGSGVYGIANFKIDNLTSKKFTIPVYGDVDLFLNSAFTCGNQDVRLSDDVANAFNMDGRTYYNGFILNGYYTNNCKACFNVENVNRLSFVLGHVDNASRSDATLIVYLDDKLYDRYDLRWHMSLLPVTVDVSSSSTVRFSLSTSNGSGSYGIAGISLDSTTSKACLVPEYSDTNSFLTQSFSREGTEIRTNDDRINSYNMNGQTYYDGVLFNGYYTNNCCASFNVERLSQITFTIGHVDDKPGSAATLYIYRDNELYTTIDLTSTMAVRQFTLPVSSTSLLRIEMTTSNGSGSYALGSVSVR